jgi:hypothetical protein
MVVQNRFGSVYERLTANCPVASKIGKSRLLQLPWNVLSDCAVRRMSLEERPDHVGIVERWFDANQFGKVLHSTWPFDARKP